MEKVKITGTKCYVNIEYDGNIVRFDGEMCVDGFYAYVNSYYWIKHRGFADQTDLSEIAKIIRESNKTNNFKVYFVNSDGSDYRI